jgi:DNA mismatch repair protein MutL
MNVINKLPPHVADLIAAGEVVERPASVVKELIENAIDAGAKTVTVEIQRGGMSYIRVSDDGCGMSPEDASTAFLRHATSKLRDQYGLEAIKTLGFRGEALAAIAAVSRIQLLTREKGSLEGTSLTLEAGAELSKEEAGCPEGTTIIVRDIFFNTPARLKFMKKDAAEGAGVSSTVIRCALSHPEVSIRYIRDGKEEFQTSGDGDVKACIYSVLGRDFANSMLKAESTGEGINVSGYVSSPAAARGNRSSQYFFVNGRFIKSQLLQAALEQAFRNSLFTGRYPACVLYIDLKHSTVDVNVHPAKTEVKFMQERPVFDAVYRAVLNALSGENEAPELKLISREKDTEQTRTVKKPELPVQGKLQQPGREAYSAVPQIREAVPEDRKPADKPVNMPEIVDRLVFSQPILVYNQAEEAPTPVYKEELKQDIVKLLDYRIIGEAFNGYIITETGDELVFIDKHAAHERLIFDKLKSQEREQLSQHLLTPIIAEPGREDAALLLENLELLDNLGFEIEDFGSGALMIRRLPADMDMGEATAVFNEISQALRVGNRPGSLGKADEVLASVACKAAIKAGKGSDPLEWKPVVESVLSGKVKYCPHGRPVTMRMSKRQLDRNFKRE